MHPRRSRRREPLTGLPATAVRARDARGSRHARTSSPIEPSRSPARGGSDLRRHPCANRIRRLAPGGASAERDPRAFARPTRRSLASLIVFS
jgi:hypothetical protein